MGWRRSKPLNASHSIRSFDATKIGLFVITLFYKSLSLTFFPRPLLLPLLILSQCNSLLVPAKNVTIFSNDPGIKFAGNWSSIPRKNLTVKATDETNAQFTFVFNGSAVYYVSRITEKGGIAGVGVDSSIVQTSVDTSSGNGSNARPNPQSEKPQILFSATGLDQNVSHTLTVINYGTGQKGGKTVELGKLLVTQGENNSKPDANINNSTTIGITSTITSTSSSTTSAVTTTTSITTAVTSVQISGVGSTSSSITIDPLSQSSSTSSGVLKSTSIGKPSVFPGIPSSNRDHIIPTTPSDTSQFHTRTTSDDGGPTSSIGSESGISAGATTSLLGTTAETTTTVETTTSAAPTNSIASTPTTVASPIPSEIPTSQTTSLDASPSVQDSSGSTVPRSNIGKVAGIVIGVVLFLFLLLCCVMTILRIKNRRAIIAARRRANPYAFSGSSFCSPGEISNDVSNNATNYREMIHAGNQANEYTSTMTGCGSNLRSSATIQISDLSNSSNFTHILEMLEEQLGPDTVPNTQVADQTRERQYY